MAYRPGTAGTTGWTVETRDGLPTDGNRYEIIDGELLVTPAPSWRHGDACDSLFLRLAAYLAEHPVGHAKTAPQDVVFDRRTVVEPDVFVVPLVEGRKPRTWEEVGRLLLAVEVLSPGSERADRWAKRVLYQRRGVPEYWIVDIGARLIERWRPGDERPEILGESISWHPDTARQPMVIELARFFAHVVGE